MQSLGSLLADTVSLSATGQATTNIEALALLDKGLQWDLCFFRMVESESLLGSFDVASLQCTLLEEPEDCLHVVWKPWSEPRGRKRKVVTWDFDFEVSSDDGCDGEENDFAEALERDLFGEAPVVESGPEEEEVVADQAREEDADPISDDMVLIDALVQYEAEAGLGAPPPEPPAAPPPPVEAPRPGRRQSANPGNVKVELPSGYIACYASRHQFYAVCKRMHATGGDCRMTRSSRGNLARPASGRPLGFLMAWLQKQAAYGTAEEHRDMCYPTVHERRAARQELLQQEGADRLPALERPCREEASETSEPDDIP